MAYKANQAEKKAVKKTEEKNTGAAIRDDALEVLRKRGKLVNVFQQSCVSAHFELYFLVLQDN